MPEKQRDEIAEALEEFVAAVVEANGEYPSCVRRMVNEEVQWVAITIGYPTTPINIALNDCRTWWMEPAKPITPNDLATVRRSRLYFEALAGKE